MCQVLYKLHKKLPPKAQKPDNKAHRCGMWGEQRYGKMQSPVWDSLAAPCQKWKENMSSEMTLLTTGPYRRHTWLHQAEHYLCLQGVYWHPMNFQKCTSKKPGTEESKQPPPGIPSAQENVNRCFSLTTILLPTINHSYWSGFLSAIETQKWYSGHWDRRPKADLPI